MGQGFQQIFFQRSYTRANKDMKDVARHQSLEKFKPLHTQQGGYNKKRWTLTIVDRGMEKFKSLYMASGNGKWCSHFAKQFPQKVKHRVTI